MRPFKRMRCIDSIEMRLDNGSSSLNYDPDLFNHRKNMVNIDCEAGYV